jgi:hypothetical protein
MNNKIITVAVTLLLMCSCSFAPSDSIEGIQWSFSKQIAYMKKIASDYKDI